MIILSFRLHKDDSIETVHHGRPTYRPGGHCGRGPISFTPMAASSRIERGDRAANLYAKGATLTDMEATVGPTSFAHMAVSSRIDRGQSY